MSNLNHSEFMNVIIEIFVIITIIVFLIALAICKCIKISYMESFYLSLIFIPGILTIFSGIIKCQPMFLFSGLITIITSRQVTKIINKLFYKKTK